MPWSLLLDWRVWVAAAFAALGFYAAVQHIGWQASKAEFAQFRADTEHLAAEAKVKNAQIALQQAHAAQEALDDLQNRNVALSDAYASLRARSGGSRVPALSAAAAVLSSCPGKPLQSDAAPRFLGEVESRVARVLEQGDAEIAKYVELWALQQKNGQK